MQWKNCSSVDEFSCGSSSCSELAPCWMSATGDKKAGVDMEGGADPSFGEHSAQFVKVAECETSGSGPDLGQTGGSLPVLHVLTSFCLALVVLFVPFTQHILNCFFHKIMGTCLPHIFQIPIT